MKRGVNLYSHLSEGYKRKVGTLVQLTFYSIFNWRKSTLKIQILPFLLKLFSGHPVNVFYFLLFLRFCWKGTESQSESPLQTLKQMTNFSWNFLTSRHAIIIKKNSPSILSLQAQENH